MEASCHSGRAYSGFAKTARAHASLDTAHRIPQFEFSRIDPNQYITQAPRSEYRKLPELLPRKTERVEIGLTVSVVKGKNSQNHK